MDRRKLKLKKADRAGETLVEVLVSFFVLVLMLTAVTMMVRAAVSMKQDAQVRLEALETSASGAEILAGSKTGEGTLQLALPGRAPIRIQVELAESGSLHYFTPAEGAP